MWRWLNGIPFFGGAITLSGTQTASDFVSTNNGGGVFIASNQVQFRRNSSTAHAEIYSAGTLRLTLGSSVSASGVLSPLVTVATLNTAGALAYTAAQVVGGLILRDCNGAGRADTVPTAADLLALLSGAQVGQAVRFTIRNTSGGATSITVTAPDASVTTSGTMTVAQNNSKDFLAVFTNVTAASEAYTLYSLGTVVF